MAPLPLHSDAPPQVSGPLGSNVQTLRLASLWNVLSCRFQMLLSVPFLHGQAQSSRSPEQGPGSLPAPPSAGGQQRQAQLGPWARRLRGEQGVCCAAARPDPDILTAALCASEARFLSGAGEKQALPLPQGGKTDGPGQAAGRGGTHPQGPGGGGHGRNRPGVRASPAPRPLHPSLGTGGSQGKRPSEWRNPPKEALRREKDQKGGEVAA